MTKRNAVTIDPQKYPIFFVGDSSPGTIKRALAGIDQDPDDLSAEADHESADPQLDKLLKFMMNTCELSPVQLKQIKNYMTMGDGKDGFGGENGASKPATVPGAMDRKMARDSRATSNFESRWPSAARIGTSTVGKAE